MAGASSGQIAARNAMQKSLAFSKQLADTAPRVLSLHRDVLRSVPWVKRAYDLPLPEAKMRQLLTGVFRKKRSMEDLHQINRLIAMGRMELEETLMIWKGESHVLGYFDKLVDEHEQDTKPLKSSFVDDFCEGRV